MQQTLEDAIKAAVASCGLPAVDFVVEHPADLTHGDYATNVALVTAKLAGTNPRAVADDIVSELEGKLEAVEAIRIAGPGFINFTLTRTWLAQQVAEILAQGPAWGTHTAWARKRVLVEYTDPNPFKEFHVGHLFTNTVGESLARLFTLAGAEVKRLNYQGDVGMHVAFAIWGMQQLGFTPDADFDAQALGQAYAKGATAYKTEEADVVAAIKAINKAVYERSDASINELYDYGRRLSLEYFETIYQRLGTAFDSYFFESEAGPKGAALVQAHPDVFTESDGAIVFAGEAHGLHTRVFINSEGLPTYEAKELALAQMKEDELGVYDHSLISTSNEITEYFKVLLKAMSLVYPSLAAKTEHIGHGTVRLTDGKMSSRTGDVIAANDFIDDISTAAAQKMKDTGSDVNETVAEQVAIAAIKYTTLKGSIMQDTVFDKKQALSFEGDSGPYLQYTYARILSAVAKAASVGVELSTTNQPEIPYEIEKLLYRFPETTAAALAERAPHIVARYLTDLAGAFNTFYASEKIADPDDQYAPYKAAVAMAVATTLKNGLWALGIEAPERM